MYKKILAAVNEHLNSEISARYALTLARACKAKFYLCFIAAKGMPKASFDRAEESIKRLFIEAERVDIRVEGITGTGRPVEEIKKIVRAEGIDIVFASTRREDIERRFFAGTVARSLSIGLSCSVALARVVHMGRIHPGKVLVPIKESIDHVRERSYFTAKMAEGFGSKLVIFHATRPITKFFHGEIHLTPAQWEKRLPSGVLNFFEYIRRYPVECEGSILPGGAARSISIEASAKRHDLIIMGASGRTLLGSFLKSSPVEHLMRETPCDLLILKPRYEDQ